MSRHDKAVQKHAREITNLQGELEQLAGNPDDLTKDLIGDIGRIDYPELFEQVVAVLARCENIELTEEHPVYQALRDKRRDLLGDAQYLMGGT